MKIALSIKGQVYQNLIMHHARYPTKSYNFLFSSFCSVIVQICIQSDAYTHAENNSFLHQFTRRQIKKKILQHDSTQNSKRIINLHHHRCLCTVFSQQWIYHSKASDNVWKAMVIRNYQRVQFTI